MKKHIMIDLETMGLRPNAAIVSIGATHFDATSIFDKFHTPVSLKSCVDLGLVTDQGTVDWWAKQSDGARSSWDVVDAPDLMTALGKFSEWLRSHGSIAELCPWGNGADFDLVLLKSAYNALEADPPWKFWNHHCFRTVKNLFPHDDREVARAGTHHNALDDAIYQTEVLQNILKRHQLTHLL